MKRPDQEDDERIRCRDCDSVAEPGSQFCRECSDARREFWDETEAEARREEWGLGEQDI